MDGPSSASTCFVWLWNWLIENPVYEDMASKYFEHFVHITDAMNCLGGNGLWHEEDGFYYDQIDVDDHNISLKIRSLVGLLPLIAVHTSSRRN